MFNIILHKSQFGLYTFIGFMACFVLLALQSTLWTRNWKLVTNYLQSQFSFNVSWSGVTHCSGNFFEILQFSVFKNQVSYNFVLKTYSKGPFIDSLWLLFSKMGGFLISYFTTWTCDIWAGACNNRPYLYSWYWTANLFLMISPHMRLHSKPHVVPIPRIQICSIGEIHWFCDV